MKWRILFAFVILFALLGINYSGIARAECPVGELYCEGWNPADQAQKVRFETMDAAIHVHAQMLADCTVACIDQYNAASRGILKALADKNHLPFDKVVLFAISEAYDWGIQATDAYQRPLVQQDWDSHAAWGLNELAARLSINPPLKIWNDGVYCVNQEYGGVCPGLW